MGIIRLVRLQEEGKLQRGDRVEVDGQSATIEAIFGTRAIQILRDDGQRSTLCDVAFPDGTIFNPAAPTKTPSPCF